MTDSSFHKSIAQQSGVIVLPGKLATKWQNDSESSVPPAKVDRLAQLVAAAQNQLVLDKLAIFVRIYDTDEVAERLPLHAFAKLSLGLKDQIDSNPKIVNSLYVYLGCLATDHVGYASFDLNVTRDAESLLQLVQDLSEDVQPQDIIAKLDLTVLPFGNELLTIDALKNGQVSAKCIVLRYQIQQVWMDGRVSDPPLPSLQQPDIIDWHLSPGSFALSPNKLIGENGCEDLYPSNLSSHQFHFHQAIRRIDASKKLKDKYLVSVRYGYLLEFRSQWFPVGHSLGKVLYSLPLAPGEKINLAIIDWTRSDTASRSEATKLTETLNHDQMRDRTISEVVNASVHEMQSGSSMMGGLGLSVLAPVGGALLGGSLGLGAASTNSSGTRNISADTTQQLSDGFHQASTAVRELRSTVITQASQVESGRYETRTLANYNHCHTLTILYYEVLRHFHVLTSLVVRRPVLFIDFEGKPLLDFNTESVIHAYRLQLESVLLDPRHLSGFEALEKKRAARAALVDAIKRYNAVPPPVIGADWVFTKMYVLFETGDDGTDGRVFLELVLKDGRAIRCRQIVPPRNDNEFSLDTARDDWVSNTVDGYVLAPETTVRWRDIRGVVVRHQRTPSQVAFNQTDRWNLQAIQLTGVTAQNQAIALLDNQVNQILMDSSTSELPVHTPPADSPISPPPQLTDFISSDDLARVQSLIDHLNTFKYYYNAALLVGADPVERGEVFKSITAFSNASLYDVIENKVVAYAGRELAFPLSELGDQIVRTEFKLKEADDPAVDFISAEDLISIPTRGVFAEGKLGYCSTCEKIDNTRFWDFQTSPIPGETPQISPLDTSSRFQAPGGLTPTNFPSSIVNIANPPAEPNPVALGAALQVLGSGSLFRDMSGAAGLASFLTSVVQGTSNAVTALAGDKRQSDLVDQIQKIPGITPEQKTALIGQLLSGKPSESNSGSGSSPSEQPASTPNIPSEPTSTPQQPKPVSKTGSLTRPTLPQPAPPPGKMFLLVAVDMKGIVDLNDVDAYMQVQPVGSDIIRVGPTGVRLGFLQAELKDEGIHEGTLSVSLSWPVSIKLTDEQRRNWAAENGQPFSFLGDNSRVPISVGKQVNIEAQVNYNIPADRHTARFKAVPEFKSIKIKEKSYAAAEIKAKVELGATFEIFSASGSLAASGSTSDQVEYEWVFTAVSGALTITSD